MSLWEAAVVRNVAYLVEIVISLAHELFINKLNELISPIHGCRSEIMETRAHAYFCPRLGLITEYYVCGFWRC